jgi:hypothetical protein
LFGQELQVDQTTTEKSEQPLKEYFLIIKNRKEQKEKPEELKNLNGPLW